MRSLYYEGVNQVGWRDIAKPKVQADHEVLVETIAASACYVDTMVISGKTPFEPPFAIGHESVARIVDKGDAVHDFAIGDIVSVPYHRTCGTCGPCTSSKPLGCESKTAFTIPSYGMPVGDDFGGMYSEYYRVPFADHALIKVPSSLDPLAAVALGDTLTDAWSTVVPHLRERPGANVLVTSNAGYGLYTVQWAIAEGAALVTYVDDDPVRNRLAKSFGAQVVPWVPNIELPPTYDIVINERQGAESLQLCLRAAAPGAVCENVVIYLEDVPIPIELMHYTGVTLRSSFCHARNFMPEVMNALDQGVINPRLVESEVIELDDVPARFVLPSHKPLVIFDRSFLNA